MTGGPREKPYTRALIFLVTMCVAIALDLTLFPPLHAVDVFGAVVAGIAVAWFLGIRC